MTRLTLSVPETAEELGVNPDLIHSLIRAGRFPHLRLGRRIVIPVKQLERWIDDNVKATG